MSVQAGIWNFDGKPVDPGLIAEFQASLEQQGPDGESCWSDSSIALLYRPFHTTAESRRESQPYKSRRGDVLTWDGRLDNREDLIAESRCYLETEPTDVAIVAAAFDHWGTNCFGRIIGDWAVCVWRQAQQELLLACDYMAIRHISYLLKNDRIWWATDLRPLVLLSQDQFEIDDDYIAGFFALAPDAHMTPYRGIRQVPPGHFIRICRGAATSERYWRFSPRSRFRYKTDAEYEEHFRHVFRKSVRRRLRSDSAILAELSGGLDSSSIVCMADDIAKKERQTSRIDTLSYYDKTEPHGDDWVYLNKVEQYREKIGHHVDTSKYGDSPSFERPDFSALPNSLNFRSSVEAKRAEIVREGCYRAILSGIGGDEFMGGVPNPASQIADSIIQFKLVLLVRQLMAWSFVKRRPWTHLLARAVLDLAPASIARHFLDQAKVEPWLRTAFVKRTNIGVRQLEVGEHFGLVLPTRRSCIGAVVHMSNTLAKASCPSVSLEESRYPYLDQTLIEFVLSIPATQLLRPGVRRSLMRRALVGIVPHDVLERRTKQFSQRTPLIAVGKSLDRLKVLFGSSLSAQLGYIDPDIFLQHLCAATNGKGINTVQMLNTISLELWVRDLASRRLLKTLVA